MNQLVSIKNSIADMKGKEVVIISREHRGKSEKIEGVLEGVYPSVFTVAIHGKTKQISSFNYSDVLTKQISIKLR